MMKKYLFVILNYWVQKPKILYCEWKFEWKKKYQTTSTKENSSFSNNWFFPERAKCVPLQCFIVISKLEVFEKKKIAFLGLWILKGCELVNTELPKELKTCWSTCSGESSE
jgi:hypothetical protein